MNQPIVVPPRNAPEIDGQSICIHEWRGSGPATLHVHHHASELLE